MLGIGRVRLMSKKLGDFWGLPDITKNLCHFRLMSRPLTELLKKHVVFIWTAEKEEAFQALKTALITAPVLALPDFSKTFEIETGASEKWIGAIMMQEGHPIAYLSKSLGSRTQCLLTYEKESLAIMLVVEH